MTGKNLNVTVKRKRPPFKLHFYYPTKQKELFDKLSNFVFNKLYPIKPSLFFGIFCLSFAYFLYNLQSLWVISTISLAYALLPVLILRTFLWLFFFRYKRYLFENPKNPSLTTKFWFVCSNALKKFAPPRLETCDAFLPRLPVPSLSDTINRYLESMRPVLEEDEFIELKQLAHQFQNNEGRKLNLYANVYSLYAKNYVTTFWEKYLYLYSRTPLLINSNVSHIDTVKQPQHTSQVSRAAELCYFSALNMAAIQNQSQKPVANGLCYNGHYKRLYCATRIPKIGCDEWAINTYSRHVTVYCRGQFYKITLFDKNGRLYSVEELQEVFIELLLRKEKKPPREAEKKLAALTQDHRDTWAKNRERFFLKDSKNRKFLEEVENSIVFVTLDEEEYGCGSEEITKFQQNMLTGNGMNRWADKSMNFVIDKSGCAGGNSEHSIADGAEFDTLMENFVCITNQFINRPKEPIDINKLTDFKPKSGVILAEKLEFDLISKEMESEIERCYVEQVERINDVDAASSIFRDFGKEQIKKCGCSPDAFMQMAIQLANYKDQKKFVLTYEATSGRFYNFSRTETLRTVSKQSCEFVKSFFNRSKDRDECKELLRNACSSHQKRNKAAMTGKGIDRHLFVLLVLSKGLGLKSKFLEAYSQQKWLLSTSQPPTMTTLLDESNEAEQWLGGAFGAVAHEGYGICYRFMGNNSIVFHITSYHSASNTNSRRFRANLEEALREMIGLFT